MFVKCFRFNYKHLKTMSDSNTDDENLSNMEFSQTQNFSQKKKFELQNGVKMKVYFGSIDRSVVHFDLQYLCQVTGCGPIDLTGDIKIKVVSIKLESTEGRVQKKEVGKSQL